MLQTGILTSVEFEIVICKHVVTHRISMLTDNTGVSCGALRHMPPQQCWQQQHTVVYWCAFRVQPNCQDVNGETPLHLAALNGHKYVSLPVPILFSVFLLSYFCQSRNNAIGLSPCLFVCQ